MNKTINTPGRSAAGLGCRLQTDAGGSAHRARRNREERNRERRNRTGHSLWCLGAAFVLALSACSGDRLPGSDEPAGKVEARQVPLQVAGASTGNGLEVETRAAGRTELTSGSIGLFRKADAANGYKAIANQAFSYATPFWSTDRQILLGEANASLAAYYPYGEEKTTPMLLNSQCYSADEDLHYVNFRANKAVSSVTLNLSRIYACLACEFFTPVGTQAYKGEGKVTAIGLEGEGIVPVATLDLFAQNTSGTGLRLLVDPFAGAYGVRMSGFTTQFSAGSPGMAECLMIPTQAKGIIRFTAMVDGAEMTDEIAAEALFGTGGYITEGVRYAVRLTVRPTGLAVSVLGTTDWEPAKVEGDYMVR